MKIGLIFLILILVFSFIPFDTAEAQLFPEQLVTCDGPDCSVCQLVGLAHNIINFIIGAAVLVATLMIAYAGILYVTAGVNPEQIGSAHKIFFNVLIGFVIVLAAWLIVDTVIKALVPSDSGGPSGQPFGKPWQSIVCDRPITEPGTN